MKIQKTIHGEDMLNDPFYVDDDKRRCPACDDIKLVNDFYFKPTTGEITIECRACIKSDKESRAQSKESEATLGLVNALKNTRARKELVGAKSSTDALNAVCEVFGGHKAAFKKVGRVISRAMNHTNTEIALKGSAAMSALQRDSDKREADEIDISKYTDEERMEMLIRPAKYLIMTSPAFRAMLLEDDEVRNALYAAAGIRVIESQPEKAIEDGVR